MIFWTGHARPATPRRGSVCTNHSKLDTITTLPGPCLVMFPILVLVYTGLARAEEREVAARFGDAWRDDAAVTAAFIPHQRAASRGGRARPGLRPGA